MTNFNQPAVLKDINGPQPIPGVWRNVLTEVVHAFVLGDFTLSRHVADVEQVDDKTAQQIRAYLSEYDTTLTDPA